MFVVPYASLPSLIRDTWTHVGTCRQMQADGWVNRQTGRHVDKGQLDAQTDKQAASCTYRQAGR